MNNSKIAVVGHSSVGASLARKLAQEGNLVEILNPEIPHYDFQIDGVKYRRSDKKPKGLLANMVMDRLYSKMNNLDGIALVSEYILIQAKKSKLSSRQRRGVEMRFDLEYEIVK